MRSRLIYVLLFLIAASIKIPLQRAPSLRRRLASSGNAHLNNVQNVFFTQFLYSANLTLGTPGQVITVQVDTGSSMTWVPSSTCDDTCQASVYFDAEKSTSFKDLGIKYGIEYGEGSCNGTLSTETITLGTSSNVTAKNQTFLLVDTETDSSGAEVAGLMVFTIQGFGFAELDDGYLTFIDSLKNQGLISSRVFSFYFSNDNFANTYDTASVCVIGEVDLTYAKSSVSYIPLYNPQGFWSVNLAAASLGNAAIQLSTDTAILDTGTSTLALPASETNSVIAILTKAGSCETHSNGNTACDCHQSHSISSYPDLVITLNPGNYDFSLTPSAYFFDVRTYLGWGRMSALAARWRGRLVDLGRCVSAAVLHHLSYEELEIKQSHVYWIKPENATISQKTLEGYRK